MKHKKCRIQNNDLQQNGCRTKPRPHPISTIQLFPLPAPVCLAYAELHFGARRRVDIYSPVSAGKYLQEVIKTTVRLRESTLSTISLLRPPPLPLSLSTYSRRLSACVGGLVWGAGGGYMLIVQSAPPPLFHYPTLPPTRPRLSHSRFHSTHAVRLHVWGFALGRRRRAYGCIAI